MRSIPPFRRDSGVIDLSTNSYLDLQNDKSIRKEALKLADNRIHGNLSSRLVSEQSELYSELEKEIVSWKGSEAALLFNSGYCTNTGILQALCTRDTEVFCDRLNHASIYDGIALSRCKLNRYRHCDMADLEKRLSSSSSKEKLIVTDSVFSMDGDRAPLGDICSLARKYNCAVMLDEAHAVGIFGREGRGLADEEGVGDEIDVFVGTLSKAVAGLGGYFAGSSLIRDFLINFSRSFIYSTALPHHVLAFNLAAIRKIRNGEINGKNLLEKADFFRASLNKMGFSSLNSSTQIVPCITGNENDALDLRSFLKTKGIIAPAIRPPTVPESTARIRFSIHLGLDNDQLDYVLRHIYEWKTRHENR
jgi:8-amino-7-oxononanoate synthase